MCQHIERSHCLGFYSIDECIRHLKEHPGWCPTLFFSVTGIWWASLSIVVTADASICGERGYGNYSIPYMWLSDIALLPWMPGFPPHMYPSTVFSLAPPSPSLHIQQQPSHWSCSKIPKLQLPATVSFRGHVSLSGVCTVAAKTVWFSFHLGFHTSDVSLSALTAYSTIQTITPMWDGTPFSVPSPNEGRSSPTNTPASPTPPPPAPVLSFYWVFHGSICSFPPARYSCLLSADVLITLLCLKVYAWCTWGNVLHIHLLPHYLALSSHYGFKAQNPQWQ